MASEIDDCLPMIPNTPDNAPRKKLLVLPRPDGFFNQIQDVHRTISICQSQHLDYVYPDLYNYVQYHRDQTSSFPFTDYFDVQESDFAAHFYPLHAQDNLTLVCPVNVRHDTTSNHKLFQKHQLSKRVNEVIIEPDLNEAIEKARHSKNNLLLLSGRYLDQVDFGVYSDYGNGQGWSTAESTGYREVVSRLRPAKQIRDAVETIRSSLTQYNAMHVRRGDYATKAREIGAHRYGSSSLAETFGEQSFYQSTDYLAQTLSAEFDRRHPILVASERPAELRSELSQSGFDLVSARDFQSVLPSLRQDIVGLVEVLLCGEAVKFIANRYSSFSTAIVNNRRIAKRESLYW